MVAWYKNDVSWAGEPLWWEIGHLSWTAERLSWAKLNTTNPGPMSTHFGGKVNTYPGPVNTYFGGKLNISAKYICSLPHQN